MDFAAVYQFHLESRVDAFGRHSGYLVIRRVDNGLEGVSKYGARIDIPGSFPSKQPLLDTAYQLFNRFVRGELSAPVVEAKEKLNGYRITGSARFHIGALKWEPTLKLKKTVGPNKGAKQSVLGHETPFPLNLFTTPENAARFALDYGLNMVRGHIQGLAI